MGGLRSHIAGAGGRCLHQMEGIQGPGCMQSLAWQWAGEVERPAVLCEPWVHRGLFLILSIWELLKWPEAKKRVPGWYRFRSVDLNRKSQACAAKRESRGPHSYMAWTATELSKAVTEHPWPDLCLQRPPHSPPFLTLSASATRSCFLFLEQVKFIAAFRIFACAVPYAGNTLPWILAQLSSRQHPDLHLSSCPP